MLNGFKRSIRTIFVITLLFQTQGFCVTPSWHKKLEAAIKTKGDFAFDFIGNTYAGSRYQFSAYEACFDYLINSVDNDSLNRLFFTSKNVIIKCFCAYLFCTQYCAQYDKFRTHNEEFLIPIPATWNRINNALAAKDNTLDLSGLESENINRQFPILFPIISALFPNLETLYLDHNGLTTFVGIYLPPSIKSLSLSNNKITQFSPGCLTNITYLNLFNNKLTTFSNNGLIYLERLNLMNNKLTEFYCQDLLSLAHLNLLSNPLTRFAGNRYENVIDDAPLTLMLPAIFIMKEDEIRTTFSNSRLEFYF